MAFAWIMEVNFEDGTDGTFDGTEQDDDGRLNIQHYSEIARTPGLAMPFRGAYAMRIDLATGINNAFLLENTNFDLTAGSGEIYVRFYLWVSDDIVMANNDQFEILQVRSASADEGVIAIRFTDASGFEIGFGELAGTTWTALELGKWISVEFFIVVNAGAGTLDLWIDGSNTNTGQIINLTHATTTHARLGVVDQDSGTTTGTLLFDQFIADDGRIFPVAQRFPNDVLLTKDGHLFVGSGRIDNITLMSGAGTDCVLTVYDTDVASTSDASNFVVELKNTANNELVDPANTPITVTRGAYVVMTGTNPRCMAKIGRVSGYGSDGAIRTFASTRLPHDLAF